MIPILYLKIAKQSIAHPNCYLFAPLNATTDQKWYNISDISPIFIAIQYSVCYMK